MRVTTAGGSHHRLRLVSVLVTAVAAGALSQASTAFAVGDSYQWAGADTQPSLSFADNWGPTGGAFTAGPPTSPVAELSFPDLGSACDDTATPTDICYGATAPNGVTDDLGPLTVGEIQIDADDAYDLEPAAGSDTIDLTGNGSSPNVGLDATAGEPSSTTDDWLGDPLIDVPITIGAAQTWDIDGGASNSGFGVGVQQITGSSALTLDMSNDGSLQTNDLSAPVTISGAGYLFAEPAQAGSATLPASGVTVESGATLEADGAPTTSGPITSSGGTASSGTYIIAGYGAAPDGVLTVTGGVNLGAYSGLLFDIDNNGSTPSTDFSQLTATGTVALNDAVLFASQGAMSYTVNDSGNLQYSCTTLKPGDSFPLITAQSITGKLVYVNSSNSAQLLTLGQSSEPIDLTLAQGVTCHSGAPAKTARAILSYGSKAITATIGGAPSSTKAPRVNGSATVGTALSVAPGTWGGYPKPAYSYQWMACSGSKCSAISGAKGAKLTLKSAQLGKRIEVKVTAKNSLGSASAESGKTAAVLASASQIMSSLRGIGTPSAAAVASVISSGSFKTHFSSPEAGTLSISWKAKTGTVATGSAQPKGSGTVAVTVHLTAAGKRLLRAAPNGLAITVTETFEPKGGKATTVTRHITL